MKVFPGIECRLFVQVEGDVVFIPSGAAHQVQNIFSCVKVYFPTESLEFFRFAMLELL